MPSSKYPQLKYALLAIASVILFGLVGNSITHAQDPVTWRCNTPSGHYDDKLIPIPPSATSVTGRILFNQLNRDEYWASSAHIGFTDRKLEDSGCHCNGISAIAYHNQPAVGYFTEVNGIDDTGEDLSPRGIDTPITFSISIDSNGKMTKRIGRQIVETTITQLPHPEHDTLRFSCSGADVSFLNVIVK